MTSPQPYSLSDVAVSYDQASGDAAVQMVDARAAREYEAGHIPDAISIPLADILGAADDNALRVVFGAAGISGDTRCVFYDDAYGAVASRAAMALESVGGSAGLLEVTYAAWKRDHSPSVEPRALEAVEFAARAPVADGMLTDMGGVERTAAESGGVILDARERLNFLSGHIPGAVNMPYHMFRDLENDKILQPPDDLRRMFENRGLHADKPAKIVTYCGSAGTLSGLAYYALRRAGFKDVGMYANSFREWKESEDVEVQQDAAYWDLSAE